MMEGYRDVWRKKMQNNGGSISNSLLNHSKKMYNDSFKDDPSYKVAKLIKHDLTEVVIDTRIINVDKTTEEKRIQIKPNNMVSIGDYIKYDNGKIYLIDEFEDNAVVPYAKVIECKQSINLKGWGKPMPCFATNDSYGTKGKLDNNYFATTDGKVKLLIQRNKYTDIIDKDFRVIFNNSKKYVYQVLECENIMDKNIYVITLQDTEFDSVRDDLVNNIAYNPSLEVEEPINPNPPPSYTYNLKADNGDMSLRRYDANTFRIVDAYNNPVQQVWEISINYNGIPEDSIQVKEIGNNYIKLVNTKGYNTNDLLINFKRNQNLLTAKIRMVN